MKAKHWLVFSGQSFSGDYGGGAQSREHAYRLNDVGVNFTFVDADGFGTIENCKLRYESKFNVPNWKKKITTILRLVTFQMAAPFLNKMRVLDYLATRSYSKVICFSSEGALLASKLGYRDRIDAIFWYNIEWRRYLGLVFSHTKLTTRIQYLFNGFIVAFTERRMIKQCKMHVTLCIADLRWLKKRVNPINMVVEIPPFTIRHPVGSSKVVALIKTPFITIGNWIMDHNRTALLKVLKSGCLKRNLLTIAGPINEADKLFFIQQGIQVLGPLPGPALINVLSNSHTYIVLGKLKTGFQTKILDGATYCGRVRALSQNLCYPTWIKPYFEEFAEIENLFNKNDGEKIKFAVDSKADWENLAEAISG